MKEPKVIVCLWVFMLAVSAASATQIAVLPAAEQCIYSADGGTNTGTTSVRQVYREGDNEFRVVYEYDLSGYSASQIAGATITGSTPAIGSIYAALGAVRITADLQATAGDFGSPAIVTYGTPAEYYVIADGPANPDTFSIDVTNDIKSILSGGGSTFGIRFVSLSGVSYGRGLPANLPLTLNVVPEPATLAFLAVCGVAALRRRR